MLNLQLAEKQEARDGSEIEIVDCFPTIQGEGPFAGVPAVFLRLAGCNLQCPACDTDYTTSRRRVSVMSIEREVTRFSARKLVVITGGEPFRQQVGPTVAALLSRGYKIQFESNGTLYDNSMKELWDKVTVVCSPKTGSVNQRLQPHISYLKYILSADKVAPDGLPEDSLNFGTKPARPWDGFLGTVYVQPCDDKDPEKNAANAQAAVDSCMRFGYTLCLQMHKIVGLP